MLLPIQVLKSFVSRQCNLPLCLPYNLTFSLTSRCNSRCKTCNIGQSPRKELSAVEWEKVFRCFGKNIFWATLSGGEPFLREDMGEIARSLYDISHPPFINIPTNGLLGDRIVSAVESIAGHCRKSAVVINLSLDGVGAEHDRIRGVEGNYDRTVRTFSSLKKLKLPNLSVGIHSVVSVHNIRNFPQIYEQLSALHPDSYVTEIAEERRELLTIGSSITPAVEEYSKIVDFLVKRLAADHFSKAGVLTRALRAEYYRLAREILTRKKQVIPCFAGYASAHIASDGDVWLCCVQAKPIGNIRDEAYDFKKLWSSRIATGERKLIKQGACFCPLANAAYTNMLHSPGRIMKVMAGIMKGKRRG